MTPKQTINDVFPDWLTGGGIFTALNSLDVPWKNENIGSALDFEYHGNVSGQKFISPMIRQLKEGETLSALEIATIANVLYSINSVNWEKQYATLSAQYNPIENYSMTEEMENDETKIEYGKTHDKTGTETTTPNLTTESNSGVYGFNSEDENPVPTGAQSETNTGDSEIEYDINDTDGGEDTHTRNYKLTRSGNIGVTTSQQMIESERMLWLWNYFYKVVFPDVDRICTINIY